MVSPATIKSQLVQLQDERNKLQKESRKASQRFKLSLGGIALGILLLPFAFLAGVPVALIAGFLAVFYSVKKSSSDDRLENVESEIHKLEISMA